VRWLIDAQLPPVLAAFLAEHGHEARHVFDLGMASAPDTAIWALARRDSCVLVTKDADFALLALSSDGPPVVWIRLGNTTRHALLARVEADLPAIVDGIARGERLIEIV
jgi:predicted nuclease of predicted toxin-antitoxin system